jgi:type III pantothenate kinase
VFQEVCRRRFNLEPLVVGPQTYNGLTIALDNPGEIGADRIVNGVAAHYLYGGPVIVIDYGTATTFDVISANKEYLGGAIAPGIGISTDALFKKASRLPRVELKKPPSPIGKSTASAVQSGVVYGFVGQLEGIVQRISQELGARPLVVATGGLCGMCAPESSMVDEINPHLTLQGLRLIYELNTSCQGP